MNYLRKTVILFIVFVIMTGLVMAEDGQKDRFYSGNENYEKGEYEKAITEYERILDSGYESAEVYYNLGNSYFRSGDLARAILNYERAERLAPGDADIVANKKFAINSTKAPVLKSRIGWGWAPFRDYYKSFSLNDMTIMASGFFFLSVLLFVFAMFSKKHSKILIISGILVIAMAAGNSVVVYSKIKEMGSQAIVMGKDIESYYGPFDSATVFFKLHEGMRVYIIQEWGDWYKIRRVDGKTGWVRKNGVERV